MDSLNKLIQYFGEFPGIGPRQARRFAYFLLTKNPSYLEELSRLIIETRKNVHTCQSCFRFFNLNNNSNNNQNKNDALCPICADPHRDKSALMIVARDVDLDAIEKSHTYEGLYFVLGGAVPILEKSPETRIRSRELLTHLDKVQPKEIILSLNANPEGEHTADTIREIIRPYVDKSGAKVTVLGRGLSTGTELEYSDSDTIKNALKNRA